MILKKYVKFFCFFLFVLALFEGLIFNSLLDKEKILIDKEEQRYRSYILAHELRQSSDDLTRMARLYVISGDKIYKKYFQDILDIRSGKKARPFKYHNSYWDSVLARGKMSKTGSVAVALDILLKAEGVTPKEFFFLEQARKLSNDLVRLENQAMHALLGLYLDNHGQYTIKRKANQAYAIKLLHGSRYHQAKEKIMLPLNNFFDLLERRTKQEINYEYKKINRLRNILFSMIAVSIGLLFLLIILFGRIYKEKIINQQGPERSINLLKEWPAITGSVLVVLMVVIFSEYNLNNIQESMEKNIETSYKSRLDQVHLDIMNWLTKTQSEVNFLAKTVVAHIPSYLFSSKTPVNEKLFTHKLKESLLLKENLFTEYIFTDNKGRVLSSSKISLYKTKMRFLPKTKSNLNTINLLKTDKVNKLFSKYIVFKSKLPNNKGFVYFLLSPKEHLNSILHGGFFGDYGDLYMLNTEGLFITEPRWKNKFIELKNNPLSQIEGSKADNKKGPIKPVIYMDKAASSARLHIYNNYINEEVVGEWLWNNAYGFGLVIESKKKEIFNFLYFYKKQNMIGLLFTVALIIILSIVFLLNRLRSLRINASLKKTHALLNKQKNKLESDLVLGQSVQMEMLPDKLEHKNFSLDAYLRPAEMVSGDFYDFRLLNKDYLYFCIGDVSGKGVGAALFMSMAKVYLNREIRDNILVKDLVTAVNSELSRNNDSCMFVTLIAGLFNVNTGVVEFVNAGHNPPYLKNKKGKIISLDKVDGPLLGVNTDAQYTQQKLQLELGDTFLLYTDGVTEAQNIKNQFYGEQRLENCLAKNFLSTKLIVDTILDDVDKMAGKAPQFDDITLLALQKI